MKKVARLLPLVGIFCGFLKANEYVYPVGVVERDAERLVFALYQKSPDHTELWQWNPTTHEACRALISAFTPVGFALLSDNAGFSFFDNGRLRIKNFLKRSPKAIDIYEPLYDLGQFTWLTSDLALFHAKEREKFSLYTLCASDGTVTKIVESQTCDCFYASLVGSSLMYLMRDKQTQEHSLMHCSCSITSHGVTLGSHKKVLSYIGALAFLSMAHEKEGIVIEHQAQIDSHTDTTLSCTCYQVVCKENDQWSLDPLFSFLLPLSLLLPSSKTRLSESIYPLLPRVHGTAIHFVSLIQGELHPYIYQRGLGVKEDLFKVKNILFTDFFPPQVLETNGSESTFVYGGCLRPRDIRLNNNELADLWLDNEAQENGGAMQEAVQCLSIKMSAHYPILN